MTYLRRMSFFAVVVGVLALAWGWSVQQMPASLAHPLWIARQEAMYLSGLLSIGLMSLAMYLATRPLWLEGAFGGMDRIYRAHKWAGILGGSFAILHWLVEMSDDILKSTIGRAGRVPKEEAAGLLGSMRGLAEDMGEWGFYLLLALLAITLWRRFPYRSWRFLHRAMPVIYLVLAFHSVLLAPRDYWTQPVGWVLAGLIVAGVHGATRALRGTIGQARRVRGEILAVVQPAPDIVAVSCRVPAGWMGHQPGQFALVTFDPAEGAHPFTIASADHGDQTIEFRIKALGDHTRQLPVLLRPGQQVDIEGPYGRFELGRINRRVRQFWVAGGIGVTPFLAWLKALQGHPDEAPEADLHYCTRDRDSDPFVTELRVMCADLPGVRLHVHGSAQGELLDANRLLADSGPGETAEIWFCGPGGLADSLRRGIAGIGRKRLSFHQEAFVMR